MKKILLLATLISSSVFANNQVINQPLNAQQGGFSGPIHGVNSVKAVLDGKRLTNHTYQY